MIKKVRYLRVIDKNGRSKKRTPPCSHKHIIGIDETGWAARKGRPRPSYIVGIDEVGRGPLAGPVSVGGVLISEKFKAQSEKLFRDIKDSKRLTLRQREEWFTLLTSNKNIKWAVAHVWPPVIDRINISNAANLAARKVYRKLKEKIYFRDNGKNLNLHVLLDGGLYLPAMISQETIIKGDEKVPIIAAASIIAKVVRDRIMVRLHKKYPRYFFDVHKGYGTKTHRARIKKFGYSKVHRKTFKFSNVREFAGMK